MQECFAAGKRNPSIRLPFHLSNIVLSVFTPVLAMATDSSATWRRRVVTHRRTLVFKDKILRDRNQLPTTQTNK
jgi:hypothetical protein